MVGVAGRVVHLLPAALSLAAMTVLGCDGGVGVGGGAPTGSAVRNNGVIVEIDEPGLQGCGRQCADGYLAFIERHRDAAAVLSDRELELRLRQAQEAPAPEAVPLGRDALGQRLRQELALDSLLNGIEKRTLTVGLVSSVPRSGYSEARLLFDDPEVGSFEALLLVPTVPGPHPAILGLHGHRDDAAAFADEFLGRQLALQGFAVLIPEFRVFDCSRRENEIASELLKIGRPLMGLRVYESILMTRYLRYRKDIDGARIGVLGHSGGASVAGLLVRISPGFKAVVTDYQVDYRNRCGPEEVHCETIPGLVPLQAELDVEGELGIPFLRVPYKFEDGPVVEAILAFFNAALGS